ncbi:MAG TPA: hypothetical protein VMM76_01445, partial [Pirellulaceae bacterium]|nr:hypothetical protein [Pirellulaceae bacterium]
PHPKTQKRGVGLPIARAVAILSLATACVMDAVYGRYAGKETGETALLRSILGSLQKGDVAVMDRYYCSFMVIALLLSQGTHVCARKHHLRHSDFRRGKRLGKYDHTITWNRVRGASSCVMVRCARPNFTRSRLCVMNEIGLRNAPQQVWPCSTHPT